MRPIGGVEIKITQRAIALSVRTSDELRGMLRGSDRVTRSAIKRVLRLRGELPEKQGSAR